LKLRQYWSTGNKSCQYSETNVMKFLFNLLRMKGLYMFRALLTHPQEAPHKRHLVYCVLKLADIYRYLRTLSGARGSAVVEALRYKPEGSGFDSWWFHWIFSLTSFPSHYGPDVDSAFNRNKYQEYFMRVRADGA
jgi:hypothetical protein